MWYSSNTVTFSGTKENRLWIIFKTISIGLGLSSGRVTTHSVSVFRGLDSAKPPDSIFFQTVEVRSMVLEQTTKLCCSGPTCRRRSPLLSRYMVVLIDVTWSGTESAILLLPATAEVFLADDVLQHPMYLLADFWPTSSRASLTMPNTRCRHLDYSR
jgi:hypothetical protein